MLLHVRINTTGGGPSWEAAERDADNKRLQKNRIAEWLVDPSVDASPDTRPTLTYCGRQLVYDKGKIEHVWPLPKDARLCGVCEAASAKYSSQYDLVYHRDDQTIAPR